MKRVIAVSALAFSLQACSDVTSPDTWRPDFAPLPVASVAAAGPSVWTVDAGANHTCAVAYNGATFCWGSNANGQLGNGTTGSSSVPVAVAGGVSLTQVSAGMFNTCGVAGDGTAYCWGYNGSGRNGNGVSTGNTLTPTAVSGGLHFLSVSVGTDHVCGVSSDHRGYCWGTNGNGRTGNGVSTGISLTPVAVSGNLSFASISAGNLHTCAVALDGTAYCWGANTSGQLGDGTTTMRVTPVAVAGSHTFASVSAGGTHSCGVSTDAGTLCWGTGQFGQLGDGVMNDVRLTPTALSGAASMALASAGSSHTCSAADRSTYCWGLNSSGQLGVGNAANSALAVTVHLGNPASLVSAGSAHTCGVVPAESAVYCWGANASGQLGNGTAVNSQLPVRVALATPSVDISVDIVPSSADNGVYRDATDPLEVALLGSGGFDPSTVDPSSVRFGGASLSGTRLQDADGDGFQDLIAQFPVADLTLPDGTSQACVTGRTMNGVPFSGCGQITMISNRAPVADAGGPYASLVTEVVTFDASASSDPDGDALTYDWDFGDGSSASGAGPQVGHAYATSGGFVATVTVSDGRGGVTRASATVSVSSPIEGVSALSRIVTRSLGANGAFKNLAAPLLASLRAAALSLTTGDTQAAVGELSAFVNKLEAAVRTGKISQAAADPLLDYARRLLRIIEG